MNQCQTLLAVCLAAGLAAPRALCEEPRLPFVLTACIRTQHPPVIDGRLSDTCWREAGQTTPFVHYGTGKPAVQATTAYLLFDGTNVYLGFRCRDSAPSGIVAQVAERDGPVYADDCIEIFLVPRDSAILARAPKGQRYFHLVANSLGTRYDEIGYEAPKAWNGQWQAAASRSPEGWELEIAVPFADLGVRPRTAIDERSSSSKRSDMVWEANFNRGKPSPREYTGWSQTYSGFHDPAHFGRVIFLDAWPEDGTRDLGRATRAYVLLQNTLMPDLGLARDRLHMGRKDAQALGAGMAEVKELVGSFDRKLQEVDSLGKRVEGEDPSVLLRDWRLHLAQISTLQRDAERLSAHTEVLKAHNPAQLRSKQPAPPYMLVATEPITNKRILPFHLPPGAKPARSIGLTACAGEYEPATFSVYAAKALSGVAVEVAPLRGPEDAAIPAEAVDVRVVKCWYQGGRRIQYQHVKVLTPELLLKDDSLVHADHEKKENVFRIPPERIRDAGRLMPVDIPADTLKQFWVTVHVPSSARAGEYQGSIRIAPANAPPTTIRLSVQVLPIDLPAACLMYSMYYRGKLRDGPAVVGSEHKTAEQYLAEMRDMKAHGVTCPTSYDRFGPLFDRAMELRKKAGIRIEPFLTLGTGTGAPTSEKALNALKQRVRSCVARVDKHGVKQLYIYGIDEAKGDRLRAERAAFRAVHEAGAKVFVACYVDFFYVVGDLLDMAVFAHKPSPSHAHLAHGVGHKILSYANPQCGVEEPETYRRNFGLVLWKAGFDGACDYAYQHAFGHIWNDFDHKTYRDHVMAYPTLDGVIPTIQWEGFREGVDDVRYLTALLDAIVWARGRDAQTWRAAAAARQWLDQLDPTGDLNEIRRQIVSHILRIRR